MLKKIKVGDVFRVQKKVKDAYAGKTIEITGTYKGFPIKDGRVLYDFVATDNILQRSCFLDGSIFESWLTKIPERRRKVK